MQQRHKDINGAWVKCNATVRKCPREHMAEEQYQFTRYAEPNYTSHLEAPMPPFDLLPGRNTQKEAICVAPAGTSGQYCPKCKHYQPADIYERPETEFGMVTCVNCSERLTFNSLGTDIRPEELKYISDAAVRKAHWFHITRSDNWVDEVQEGDAMVHLGSHEAAMIRLRDILHEDSYIDPDADDEEAPEEYYLYEVRLKPKVDIARGIFRDQEALWPETAQVVDEEYMNLVTERIEPFYPPFSKSGVSRYLNEYEGAGTISLLAHADAYELVAKVPIPHKR